MLPNKRTLILLLVVFMTFVLVSSYVKAAPVDDLINWLRTLFQSQNVITGGIAPFGGSGYCDTLGSPPSGWTFTCTQNGQPGGCFTCKNSSGNSQGTRCCSTANNEICNGPTTGQWPCSQSSGSSGYTYSVSASGLYGAWTNLYVDGQDSSHYVGCLSSDNTNGCAPTNQLPFSGTFTGNHSIYVQSSVVKGSSTCNIIGNNGLYITGPGSHIFYYTCGGTGATAGRIDSITVYQLDKNCNAISGKSWVVWSNGNPTGQVPTIPTWSSGTDCSNGNMRIDMRFTNTGSSSGWFSFDTQTVAAGGQRISTNQISVGANQQGVLPHWIRMWAQDITERNWLMVTSSQGGAASQTDGPIDFQVKNGGTTTSNNVRLDKITVSWLDASCVPIQVWDVYANGAATGQVPTIPTWTSTNNCAQGNMRINYDFTNIGSSGLYLSVQTQTHGQQTGLDGGIIETPQQLINPNTQAHQAHWIRMWSENILERNTVLVATTSGGSKSNGPSFDFSVNNGIPAGEPCSQDGVCWPDTTCADFANVHGFCVSKSYYDQHQNWFQQLSQTYYCGANFCLVANVDNDGCWNTRGFCYTFNSQSPTGCVGPTSAQITQECQNRGGNLCSSTVGSNAAIIDPTTAYHNFAVCQNTAGTSSSSSSSSSSTSTTVTTTTTASQSTTTNTMTTTTTPTAPLPLPINCNTCLVNSQCECTVAQSDCTNGVMSVTNKNNNPLPAPNATVVGQPMDLVYYPKQTGSVNVTALCFDPFPKSRGNSTEVPVLNPFIVCPSQGLVNVPLSCQVNNCNSGYVQAVQNNALLGSSSFTSTSFTLTFTAQTVGSVSVSASCNSPPIPLTTVSIPILSGLGTTTTTAAIGTFTGTNFQCIKLDGSWQCSFAYNNKAGQDIIVQFSFANSGVVAQPPNTPTYTIAGQGSSIAKVTFDCNLNDPGTYVVSWKAYRDETRRNPIAWAAPSSSLPQVDC